ncbi:uncharacterized protein H6S33_008990 [Morchella sextelata]|uniref:uncharacterized protein n=1 Tax=Morchella sextelata TaxID=1174677 RepID=UPI001D054598|nr:uncharacterized protein H6S33_008990 [Morchella sextelata]KAH0612610.1 hypothetical protein H6S33_008990 [Morchella sextelata]
MLRVPSLLYAGIARRPIDGCQFYYSSAATANKPEAEEVWVVLEHFVRFKKSFDCACVSITYSLHIPILRHPPSYIPSSSPRQYSAARLKEWVSKRPKGDHPPLFFAPVA